MEKVTVVGLGFVGAAMSLALASSKRQKRNNFFVYGLDRKSAAGKNRIKSLNEGRFPFKSGDKTIPKMFSQINKSKNFLATSDIKVLNQSKIIIVSIGFDVTKNQIQEILNFKKLIRNIAQRAKKNSLIVIESTLPPGFTEKVIQKIFIQTLKRRKMKIQDCSIVYSYERVMPGDEYINSIINNYRVISANDQKSLNKSVKFFSKFINYKKFPFTLLSKTSEAETSKIIENSYRSVNIAFINEWAKYCEKLDLNLNKILTGIRKRPSHSNIRYPGLSVGGYCLTKDPLFAKFSAEHIHKFKNLNFPFSTQSVRINKDINNHHVNILDKKIKKTKGTALIYGISYKNEIGDTRNTPSKKIYDFLKNKNYKVFCSDPYCNFWDEKKIKIYKNIFDYSIFDIIIFCTNHKKYKIIDFTKIKLKKKIKIFDLNNCLTDKQCYTLNSKNIFLFKYGD